MNSRKRMSKLMPFHCICLLIDEDFAILRFSVNYGSPKGTSVLTLNQSLFFSKIGVFFFWKSEFVQFSKIGVCFFWKSEFVFWKSEFVFLTIRVCFFRKSEFVFWKIGVWILEIGVCLFWKSEFVLFKIGVGPRFCAVILLLSSSKISGGSRGGAGGPGAPFIFRPNWGPKGRKKTFWWPLPSLSLGLDDRPPPSPLSEGLYSSLF